MNEVNFNMETIHLVICIFEALEWSYKLLVLSEWTHNNVIVGVTPCVFSTCADGCGLKGDRIQTWSRAWTWEDLDTRYVQSFPLPSLPSS